MTSAAGEGAIGANHESSNTDNGEDATLQSVEETEEEIGQEGSNLARILTEERERKDAVDDVTTSFSSNYGKIKQTRVEDEVESETLVVPCVNVPEAPSSNDGSLSVPDDTPSIQGSLQSGISGNLTPARASLRPYLSPSPRPSFDRRFHARNYSSPSVSRANSPAFLTAQSRQSSHLSQLTTQSWESEKDKDEEEEQQLWEVVRWTKLRKISGHAFSEVGKRTFGRPTYLTIAASIAIGTSKGLILLFDYQQNLKTIIGQGTPAAESGSVTSLAISADHSTVAAGHANGSIFTWEISKSAKPFLNIPSQNSSNIKSHKNDGHISDCAVLHVGFLGQRHTALVSADDCGMAFSHLATRGLGTVGRIVKTTRILGRYPDLPKASLQARKPSSVLAFSPLPLGNIERTTDTLGLTALLTPYLLVIVSTTPVAQTQFKLPRSKLVAAHSAMTGCLAWFPAVKLKNTVPESEPALSSDTKLVYCWSNMLSVLEIDEDKGNSTAIEENRPPVFHFRPRSHWECEEAVLAVQWLSRSIMAILTVTQRLIILEDHTMNVANSSDLNPKHIFHQDLFSRQLQSLVDKIEEEDNSMHGVIPDAYHMSFKAYKGRLFLLGMSEVSMGTLLNWADRLMSLMEAGKYISAIELATAYYVGEVYSVTIGLPSDNTARQTLVKDKLMELLLASLRFLTNVEEQDDDRNLRNDLQSFATVAFAACVSMDEINFLFDEMYEIYSDASMQDVFLYALEPYIIDGKIEAVPPSVSKDLMNWYSSLDLGVRLEQIICALQPNTMDIDQVTGICKQQRLYDALIHVWTQGLRDYVTPLIELISLANHVNSSARKDANPSGEDFISAMKIFPYMAYTLTGRQYPGGSELEPADAIRAKASMYGFLFSDRPITWPKPRGKLVTMWTRGSPQPTFPYLKIVLHFDVSSFMSMLNEVFEDSYLNGGQDQVVDGLTASEVREESLGMSVNRQRLVNILLEAMSSSEFDLEEKTYLNIFIARNMPKFAQFILLPGSTLRQTLVELCNCPQPDLASECQLSVEYLLSIYHPPDMQGIINLLHGASFYRVLKSVYRGDKQYAKWLEAFFQDPEDRQAVFSSISDCLKPSTGLTRRQVGEVKEVLVRHGKELVMIDARLTATTIESLAPDILEAIFDSLDEGSQVQYRFLGAIIESDAKQRDSQPIGIQFTANHREQYVELMCQQEPAHVVNYISSLNSGDLHLDRVLSAMEASGVVDAAVTLLARDGLVREAMDRLVKHLITLKVALTGFFGTILDNPDMSSAEEAITDLLEDIGKYVKLGIWLCQGQGRTIQSPTASPGRRKLRLDEVDETSLTVEEALWLDLIDTVVIISRAVNTAATTAPGITHTNHIITKATDTLRLTVQSTFTALLATTSTVTTLSAPRNTTASPAPAAQKPIDHRFLHILRAFLTRASHSSPTLSDLRKVLSSIFSAYAFEASMLSLANAFLDKDVFAHVEDAQRLRNRGWRPRSQLCEGCKRRAWGPGTGEALWKMWDAGVERAKTKTREKWAIAARSGNGGNGGGGGGVKGKGRAVGMAAEFEVSLDVDGGGEEARKVPGPDRLVVFSCSHLFHQRCLEVAMREAGITGEDGVGGGKGEVFKCPLCVD